MVLEAVIVCLDNSDWTRNGDYHPSRWESEVEAANLVSESKCEKNPENGIGVISMAGKRVEVHVTLTNDLSRILNAIKGINISGDCDFVTSLNIATLVLKHRPNKNQKQRIIAFVGSPLKHSVEEMVQLGKKLKKYNIAVDVISFGNVDENKEHLKQFIDAVNNANNSSIVEVPVGFYLIDSLFTSPILSDIGGFGDIPMEGGVPSGNAGANTANTGANINQQGGSGMTQFERDMNLAIQASMMEEERKNQQSQPKPEDKNVEMTPVEEENEEDELEKARLLSMKEHEEVLKKQKAETDKVKDELLENPEFIKEILEGMDSTEIKDEEIQDIMKKMKDEKKKDENNEEKK